MLFKGIDKVMLYSMISSSSVAIYGAAIRILNLFEYPATAMSEIVFPKSAESAKNNNPLDTKRLYEKSVGALLAFMVPGIVMVWIGAKYIILIVAGAEYMEAVSILRVVLLFTLFTPFTRQFGTILDSMGLPKINFKLLLLSSVVNLGSNYFFITHFGVIGAAFGTLVTLFFSFIVGQIILYKKLNIRFMNCLIYQAQYYKTIFDFIFRNKK